MNDKLTSYPAHHYLNKQLEYYPDFDMTSGHMASSFRNEFGNLLRSQQRSEAIIRELVGALRAVIEDGVQKTTGEYPSSKNNKCHHGNFGFEGCEGCIEEYLLPFYNRANQLLQGEV